jgi:hypothetical protein
MTFLTNSKLEGNPAMHLQLEDYPGNVFLFMRYWIPLIPFIDRRNNYFLPAAH